MTTLKSRWQFALLAAFLYVTAPVVEAVYYWVEDGRGAYPSNADSIGIPLYYFTIALLAFSPIYALIVWLATRSYQGGLSLLAFNVRRPSWCGFWSLLLVGLIAMNLYDAAEKAVRVLPLDVISDLAWSYLLLCLRSSLAGIREQQSVRSGTSPLLRD